MTCAPLIMFPLHSQAHRQFRHCFALLRVAGWQRLLPTRRCLTMPWPDMLKNGSTRSLEETKELAIVYDRDANVGTVTKRIETCFLSVYVVRSWLLANKIPYRQNLN